MCSFFVRLCEKRRIVYTMKNKNQVQRGFALSELENNTVIDEFHPRLHGIREEITYSDIQGVKLYHNRNTIHFPPHWHAAIEILYPLEENYTVRIGTQEHELVPGDILVVAPGTIHSYTPPETGERIFILFDYNLLQMITSMRQVMQAIQPYLLITQTAYPPLNEKLQSLLQDVIREYDEDTPYSGAIIWSRLLEFFAYLGRTNIYRVSHSREFPKDKRQEYVAKFMEVCNYITDHLDEEINTDRLAEIAGFSKFHFSRLFKEFTGCSSHEYLIQRRLEAAEQLLANPDLSITDVAMQSGFNSLSTFTRVFKAEKEMTPSAFREMNQKGNHVSCSE